MLLRSLVFIISLFIFNGVQAANRLIITLEQNTQVSVLKLQSSFAPDIIWKDENDNTTELPLKITSTNTIPFYSGTPDYTFVVQAIYSVEENSYPLENLIQIDMNEKSCLINGKPEDIFETQKYSYILKAEGRTFEPNNTTCEILIKIEEQNGELPVIQLSIDNQSQTSLVPSEAPKNTGTLTQGNVTVGHTGNNQTSCSATNFNDCISAATQIINAGNVSPLFNFTADPSNWILEGELRYIIQDPELNTNTQLIVTLQNGDTILEQCVAQISPEPTGQIRYWVETNTADKNQCKVTLYRKTEPLPNSPTMQLVINNQIGKTAGTTHTFALKQNQVQVEQGIFNAIPTDIPVNQNQNIIISALYGANSHYQSQLFYEFDDYLMNTVPTGLLIEIDNTKVDTTEWCKAASTGWNEGYRLYQVSTEVTGDSINIICTVNITSEDNTRQPVSYGFSQIDELSTEGIRQWEHFAIDGQTYLAAANAEAKNTDYITQNIFRFDRSNNRFIGLNNLLAGYRCVDSSYNEMLKDHVYAWQFFEIDNHKRLVMANNYSHPYRPGYEQQCDPNQINRETASYIYDWQNGEFNIGDGCCDSITTDSPTMMEFYQQNGQSYLAVAELGLAGKSNASIYQWQSGKFVKMTQSSLNVPSTRFIEAFSIEGQTYLIFSFGIENQDSVIYRVEANGQLVLYQGKTLTPNQALAQTGFAINSNIFTIGNDNFLILGFSANNSAPVWLYRWEYVADIQKSLFVPYQLLPDSLKTAANWASFTVNNKPFLTVILEQKRVVAYQWNNILQKMEIVNAYPLWATNDLIAGVTTFNVDQTNFMAVAVERDQNNNTRIKSPILRWQQK